MKKKFNIHPYPLIATACLFEGAMYFTKTIDNGVICFLRLDKLLAYYIATVKVSLMNENWYNATSD